MNRYVVYVPWYTEVPYPITSSLSKEEIVEKYLADYRTGKKLPYVGGARDAYRFEIADLPFKIEMDWFEFVHGADGFTHDPESFIAHSVFTIDEWFAKFHN